MTTGADPDDPRRIHPLLLIGLISMPILFVGFLSRKGHARSTRRVALIYTFLPIALAIAGVLLQALVIRGRS